MGGRGRWAWCWALAACLAGAGGARADELLAPTGLTVTAIAYDEATLTWGDASSGEAYYAIEGRVPGSGPFDLIALLPANSTTGVAHLPLVSHYELRVRPTLVDWSAATPSASLFVSPPDYPAPTDVAATAPAWNRIAVTWTDTSDDESSFRVQYRPAGQGEWVDGAWAPANATSAEITWADLEPSTAYEVRVRAFLFTAGGTLMTPSAAVTVTTPAFPAPSDVVATAIDWNELRVSWTDNSLEEMGFWIEYREQGETEWQLGTQAWQSPATIYGYLGEVEAGTTYEVRVVPLLMDWSTYTLVPMTPSEVVVVTTPAYPSPTDVVATAIDWNELRVSWTDNSDDEQGFRVEYREQGEAEWRFGTQSWQSPGTIYGYLGEVEAGTTYEVRVVPLLMDWSTYTLMPAAPSDVVVVTTPAYPSPTDVVATAVDWNELRVSWTDNSDDEQGFRVELRAQGETEWQFGTQTWQSPATIQGYLGEVEAGTTYEVRVVPLLMDWSTYTLVPAAPSAVVMVTTPAYPSPTDVVATAVDWNELRVSWTDNSDDEQGFRVELRAQGETEWQFGTQTWQSPATIQGYLGEVQAGTTYEVRVVPLVMDWWTYTLVPMPPSAVVTVTTPAYPSPTDVEAEAMGPTELLVSWTDESDDEMGFRIEVRAEGETDWTWAAQSWQSPAAAYGLEPGTTYEVRVVPLIMDWSTFMLVPMPPSEVVVVTTPE